MKHYHKKALYNLLQYVSKHIQGPEHDCDNAWDCDHISHDMATLEDLLENPHIEETLTYIRKEGL